VSVYCSDYAETSSNRKLNAFATNENGIVVSRLRSFRIFSIDALTIIPALPFRMFLKPDFDAVFVNGYGYFVSYCAIVAAKLGGKPVLFTPHYSEETTHPAFVKKIFDLSFGRVSFGLADKIICLTRTEKKKVSATFRVPLDKITILPNGIEVEKYFHPALGKKAVKKYRLGTGKKILFVGRLAKNKGLEYLLRAFPTVLLEYPDARLLIVGEDNGQLAFLNRLARELRIDKNTKFLGKLMDDDFYGIFNCADVFALPSFAGEAFGIVLLEAMASGLPVVASNVGGVRCLIKKQNGAVIPPKDSRVLAAALISALAAGKERYGEANIAESRKYDADKIAGKIMAEMERLVRL